MQDRPKLAGMRRLMLAFVNSWQGFKGAFRSEAAFRQEVALAVVLLPLGAWLGKTPIEKALLVASVLLVLIVGARPVLSAFGPGFADASWLLVLLGFDQLIGALFGISGYLLVMTGHQVTAARVIIGCAVLNLVLTFILTPLLGMMGAGLATTITTLIRSYLLVTRMRSSLGLSLSPLAVQPEAAAP